MQHLQATKLPTKAEHAVIEYSVTDTEIARMSEQYMPLTVAGFDDRKGLAIVHAARMDIRTARVAVEKKRKELKAEALEYGRAVDGEAKRITKLLEPIEDHLKGEEDRVKAEKDRLKAEKEAERQAVLNARLEKLTALEHHVNPSIVEAMTDDKFCEVCMEAEVALTLKRREAAEREAKAKAEAERLAKERVELAKQQAKIKAERDALEAAKQVVERERDKAEAAENARIETERKSLELEKAKAELAEKVRIETEQRIAAEAQEKERLEKLRPDKEKIRAVANDVASVEVPELSKQTPSDVVALIRCAINAAAEEIREIADCL